MCLHFPSFVFIEHLCNGYVHLGLATTDLLSVGGEGGGEIAGGEQTVLVRVHDAEGLQRHHLDLGQVSSTGFENKCLVHT